MHRVDTPGHVAGLFSAGNPAAGQIATRLSPDWLNDIQENLCYVIEEQGIVLEKGNEQQLSEAIVALVYGAVGDGSGNVPTTRQITAAGLATGGGSLAADRTITVPKASAAEVAAMTNDTKAITPLALAGAAGARDFTATGYVTILGFKIVWVTATANANGSTTVTLPSAFPNQCVHADFSGGDANTTATENNPFVSGKSAGAVTLFNAANGPIAGTLFAIGF